MKNRDSSLIAGSILQRERINQQKQSLQLQSIQKLKTYDDFASWVAVVAPKVKLNAMSLKAVYEMILADNKVSVLTANQCLSYFEKILQDA